MFVQERGKAMLVVVGLVGLWLFGMSVGLNLWWLLGLGR